jgi:predicted transcriptional regulator
MERLKPDLNVLVRILNLLRVAGPLKKTHLCHKANMSYTEFQRYLRWMNAKGLTELMEIEGMKKVCLTSSGLQSLEALELWLSSIEGGADPP